MSSCPCWAHTRRSFRHKLHCTSFAPHSFIVSCQKKGYLVQNIDDGQFEYNLIGNGKQNVVFINGFRMKFDSWNKVYPNIAENYSVLLFNRHGVGSSSKATIKQTGNVVVNEIHTFLSKLEIKPPYLFVAHSLGGIYANLFIRTYPNEVSGVVFVDAPHPSEIVELRAFRSPLILRAINEGIKSIERMFDKFKYSEDECIEETVSQIQGAGSFPNVPVTVLSGTKKMPFVPPEAFDIHLRYQRKLLVLSKHSRQYFCNKSSHFPQITEPEIVIEAIMETAGEVKNS